MRRTRRSPHASRTVYHASTWTDEAFVQPSTDYSDEGAMYFTQSEKDADFFASWHGREGTEVMLRGTLSLRKPYVYGEGDDEMEEFVQECFAANDRDELYGALQRDSYDAFIVEGNYPNGGDDVAVFDDDAFEVEAVKLKLKSGWTDWLPPDDAVAKWEGLPRENPDDDAHVRFVYGARRLARGGFAPVVTQHGPGGSAHEHGGWVAQGYDEDVALAVAKEHAEELASQYVGDWNIEIVPESSPESPSEGRRNPDDEAHGASLGEQLAARMDDLFAGGFTPARGVTKAKANDVSRWMRDNMTIFGRAPAQAKNIKASMENLAELLSNVPEWGAQLEEPLLKHAWHQTVRHLPEVEMLARSGGAVPTEVRAGEHTFLNEAGLSADSFKKYIAAMTTLFDQLEGWRRGALKGGVVVVFAGPKSFRGTSAGKYQSEHDRLLVRATPAVLKRGSGTYGAPDYIIVHELGHRFERKNRLPTDFDKVEWLTTAYSQKEGEAFAELFALGHFGMTEVHGDRFGDRVEAFDKVMREAGRSNPRSRRR